MKHWNFRKADWSRFCLLTGESVKRLSPPDKTNIENTCQELCESLLLAAKQSVTRITWHVGTNSAKPFIAPSCNVQWILTLMEPICPYFLSMARRGQSDKKKLSIPSTSCSPVMKSKAPSTNLLAGPDTPCLCSVSGNNITPQLVKKRAHKMRDRDSTRLMNKVFNLWKAPTPEGDSISGPFMPEELANTLNQQ